MAATTPRKKPAPKRPTPAPSPYRVDRDTFIADTSDGELQIPLRFKTRLIRAVRELDDPVDQLFTILEGVGDSATAEALDELDFIESLKIADAFFDAWREKNEASLGERQRSSS